MNQVDVIKYKKKKSIQKCHVSQNTAGILAKEIESYTENSPCLIKYMMRPQKKACRTCKEVE